MAGMEVDSPPEQDSASSASRERIIQRLAQLGVPFDRFGQSPSCLVDFMKDNEMLLSDLIFSILPTIEDVAEIKKESKGGKGHEKLNELYPESLLWIQWMMFGRCPRDCLKDMAQDAAGQRAVCGAVWGQNDLAYRCRTCEHDPTCAICVPCFQNGDHKDHDYSIMYTGGGCCDCGDETAWKSEGFCSKHKGTGQIQPLSEELASSVGPVLDVLLLYWRDKLVSAENSKRPKNSNTDVRVVAVELTSAIVSMLLDFCNCSESLLSFISGRMYQCSGLLDVLLRAERFLDREDVVNRLHELLLKLLGDPSFKYEFGKAFVGYYPVTVREIVKECSDSMLEKYPLLSTFSVQIFTVPTLTPRLVQEVDLLSILLKCLTDLFSSCVGVDGHFQVSKWANIEETTIRMIEDARFVISHAEVSRYIAEERYDIYRAWLRLLGFVQGMDPQKRVTSVHIEEDNDNSYKPFHLGSYLGNFHKILVEGAYSLAKSKEIELMQSSSSCFTSGENDASDHVLVHGGVSFIRGNNSNVVPASAVWLIFECLKTIENWILRTSLSLSDASSSSGSSFFNLRKKLFRIRSSSSRVYRNTLTGVDGSGNRVPAFSESAASPVSESDPMDTGDSKDMHPEYSCMRESIDGSHGETDSSGELGSLRLLNLADWPNVEFDVSSQEISFHIPVHRLLSLLLRRALATCYSETGGLGMSHEVPALFSSRQHDFFEKILNGVHPCGFSAHVMENPLRLRVFCAQVRAGMWRKNGDAAILCYEGYRSVQWLEIGIEHDLFLLQCCAALAPPELFVKRIQERFGLANYTALNLADHNEYEPVLALEMLNLIIQIVKERRFCGLSITENLRRELVYKLAIGDATHSQLVKALPRDLSKSDQLQNTLDKLTQYSKPSGMKQGKYSLRRAFWKELDLYHPRWNSRDLQAAEERYLRFCNVSSLNAQLPRWTPIFHPLIGISRIATSKSVLQFVRAVVFYAVYTEMPSLSRAPDAVLITALHLLSLGLDICETQLPRDERSSIDGSREAHDLFPILAYASEEFDAGAADEILWKNQSLLSLLVSLMKKHKEDGGYHYAEKRQCNISSLIENLLKKFAQLSPVCMDSLKCMAPDVIRDMSRHSPNAAEQTSKSSSDMEERKAKARKRQAEIMEKMRAEQSKFIASLKSEGSAEPGVTNSDHNVPSEGDHSLEESAPVCCLCRGSDPESPLCYLILLQKSRLTSFVDRRPASWDDVTESEICRIEKVATEVSGNGSNAPIQFVQSTYLDAGFSRDPAEVNTLETVSGLLPEGRQIQPLSNWLSDTRAAQPLDISNVGSTSSPLTLEMLEDIVYQSVTGKIYGIQHQSNSLNDESKCPSSQVTVGSQLGGSIRSLSMKILNKRQSSMSTNVPHSTSLTARFSGFDPEDCDGIHLSSCGHAVHQECHNRYLLSLKQRHLRRLGFEGGHIVDPDQGEMLCPLCRRFSNSVMPAFLPSVSNKAERKIIASDGNLRLMDRSLHSLHSNNKQLLLALSLIQHTSETVGDGRHWKVLSGKHNITIESALEPVLRKLCRLYGSQSYDNLSASKRLVQSLALWNTFIYSLVSTEIAARGRMKSCSSGSLSLEALYEELYSSNGFILSLLLRVAHMARASSHCDVLLRFQGIQLLAGSICSGVTRSSDLDKKKGALSSILENFDKGEAFPDAQFCKRAADPILAHDPFSSLMWTLFCFPIPFMSSIEFFFSLVQLFYCVSVVQGLITCYSRCYFDESCFSDCVLSVICKMMGESEFVRKYFVSNYIDTSCHPKDMIRRFTLPYLRRCALLWKMLQSSTSAPMFNESSRLWGSNSYTTSNSFDNAATVELNRVEELEDMFRIQSLELVLKDEVLSSLALKWCNHFCEVFRVRNFGPALYATPAVPFKLVQLPRLYQDLLERYVKLQCSGCKTVPDEPALCLLCGRLCTPSWKSCCRSSRCLNHSKECGAGIGVYLLVRRTTVLLQRCSRQASWPSPYLDAFGEEDHEITRGKPLYLSEERYAALTYMVASHGLDQTSEVLRYTIISLDGIE